MSGVHEPQYSVCQEVRLFFSQGLPLLLLNILKTGVPPLFTMVVAGRTPESATLQASLGYARTFYNCITLMPLMLALRCASSSRLRSLRRAAQICDKQLHPYPHP